MKHKCFRLFSNLSRYSFAESRVGPRLKKSPSVFLDNKNFHFEDDNFIVQMLPAYPQLTLKDKNTLYLISERVALFIKFIKKSEVNVSMPIRQEQNDIKKVEELSFSAKYSQLATFLEVEPYSNRSVKLVR